MPRVTITCDAKGRHIRLSGPREPNCETIDNRNDKEPHGVTIESRNDKEPHCVTILGEPHGVTEQRNHGLRHKRGASTGKLAPAI